MRMHERTLLAGTFFVGGFICRWQFALQSMFCTSWQRSGSVPAVISSASTGYCFRFFVSICLSVSLLLPEQSWILHVSLFVAETTVFTRVKIWRSKKPKHTLIYQHTRPWSDAWHQGLFAAIKLLSSQFTWPYCARLMNIHVHGFCMDTLLLL